MLGWNTVGGSTTSKQSARPRVRICAEFSLVLFTWPLAQGEAESLRRIYFEETQDCVCNIMKHLHTRSLGALRA